jgi:hypothetical protein
MTQFGYTAMREQTPARQLITDLVAAEAAGFDFSVMSDHYFPWLEEQGYQGRHFQVERAKLYDLPGQVPPIGIAVSGQLAICYDRDEKAARRRAKPVAEVAGGPEGGGVEGDGLGLGTITAQQLGEGGGLRSRIRRTASAVGAMWR